MIDNEEIRNAYPIPTAWLDEGSGSIRATPSLRPNLDFLYQLNFNINLSRLTLPVDQFA